MFTEDGEPPITLVLKSLLDIIIDTIVIIDILYTTDIDITDIIDGTVGLIDIITMFIEP
jgi:hypothetical protein